MLTGIQQNHTTFALVGSYLNWMQIVSGISKLNLTHESAVEWLTVATYTSAVFIAEGIR